MANVLTRDVLLAELDACRKAHDHYTAQANACIGAMEILERLLKALDEPVVDAKDVRLEDGRSLQDAIIPVHLQTAETEGN